MQTTTDIDSLFNTLVAASIDPALTKRDLACLTAIMNAVGEPCSPVRLSFADIAAGSGTSVRQAVRNVHRLVYLGYITRRSGDERTANTYTIRPHAAPVFSDGHAQGGERG